MSKGLLILSTIFGLAAAGLGFMNNNKVTALKGDVAEKTTAVATAQGQLKAKTEEAAKSTEALTVAEAKAKESADAAEAAKKEREAAKAEVATYKSQVEEKTSQITDLNAQITALKDAALAVNPPAGDGAGAVAPAPGEVDELKVKVAELEELKNSLTQKLEAAEANVAAAQKRESDRQAAMMRPGTEGRIMAVNPDWNFVILSIGDRQGVSPNAELIVQRGGAMVGKVKVSTVSPNRSVANIDTATVDPGNLIQPGDTVIFPRS